VRLWDLTDLRAAPAVLDDHENGVTSVTFSPDGQLLASASWNQTVLLWNLADLAATPSDLASHSATVTSVAFSSDGQTLASGSEDGTVRLWIVHTEMLSDLVCSTVLRNLTLGEWHQFIGEEMPYERTCPNLPAGDGAPS
jgi:WD40 repeat protein